MANIVVRVTEFNRDGIDPQLYTLAGLVIADEGSGAPHEWATPGILLRANLHVVNQAILDAAIQALEVAESISVTDTSRIRVFGGAT